MEFRPREKDDPRLSVAPLVDILFILIIFFVVTTTFATSGGIDVSLPKASTERPLEKTEKLFVIVNRDGKVFVEGERMSPARLRERFDAVKAGGKDVVIIIQADRDTQHGRVVAIMDMAQEAGLSRMAIAVERKGELDLPGLPAPAPPADDAGASDDGKTSSPGGDGSD